MIGVHRTVLLFQVTRSEVNDGNVVDGATVEAKANHGDIVSDTQEVVVTLPQDSKIKIRE